MDFYRSNNPTNSIKALKEDRVLASIQTCPRYSCYNNITHIQLTKTHKIHTDNTKESMHSEISPVKPNTI